MKILLNFVLLSTVVIGLSGCDPFEGLLKVKKEFTVISTDRLVGCGNGESGSYDCEQKTAVKLPVGEQTAKLNIVGNNQLQVTVKINGKKRTINMVLPKKLNIPSNGAFIIPTQDLGQNFSARGDAMTRISDSFLYRGYEQCTYTRYDWVCQIINGQQVCQQVPRTVYGQQYVEFFNRNTDQNLNVNFVDSALLATFTGERHFLEKIYTFKAQCY